MNHPVKNKIISYISLAKKSGSLSMGFDSVKSSVINNKTNLVLLAHDLSSKSIKEILHISKKHHIPCIILEEISINDLSLILSKKVGIVCIDNDNLYSAIMKIYPMPNMS